MIAVMIVLLAVGSGIVWDLWLDSKLSQPEPPETLTFKIQREDVVTGVVAGDQIILRILQDRGAPIVGAFYLKVKDGWESARTYDHLSDEYTFTFIEQSPTT